LQKRVNNIYKKVASESYSNFIALNISELISCEVGESEKKLSNLFRTAKLKSPCILFFDEIQSVFGDRNSISKSDKKLVSQFLLEFDNMREEGHSIVVIGATNIPKLIDPSLLRPGRFEKVMHVKPPNKESRKIIFENQLKKMNCEKEIFNEINFLVEKTDQYTGADIINLCYKAGLNALNYNSDIILMEHFIESINSFKNVGVNSSLVNEIENWEFLNNKNKNFQFI
jgi:transitional endoplasmic reticulum ATPase